MKILVIDDSKEDREIAITRINQTNLIPDMTADESNCLKAALEKLRENEYDVIILDLALPETDGLDTINEVNKFLEQKNRETPIVILTGLEDYSLGIKAFSLGVKDFLIKDEYKHDDITRALKCATYGRKRVKTIHTHTIES